MNYKDQIVKKETNNLGKPQDEEQKELFCPVIFFGDELKGSDHMGEDSDGEPKEPFCPVIFLGDEPKGAVHMVGDSDCESKEPFCPDIFLGDEPKEPVHTVGDSDGEPKDLFCPVIFLGDEPKGSNNLGKQSDDESSKMENKLQLQNKIKQAEKLILDISKEFFLHNSQLCRNIHGQIQRLGNFELTVLKREIHDDGIQQKEYILLELKILKNGKTRTIGMTKRDFLNSDWINVKGGTEFTLAPGYLIYEHLKEYISQQVINAPLEFRYSHIGWRRINHRFVYLHAGGGIGDNTSKIRGSNEYLIEVDERITPANAYNFTLDMLNIAKDSITIPLLSFTLLSIQKALFEFEEMDVKKIRIQTLLWLHGETGTRKSTIAKLFTNIFNRSKDSISGSFEDTKAAIEYKAFVYKDSIFLLDDYKPVYTAVAKKEMMEKAFSIIRRYGDNIPRSRMDKNMNRQKEYPPRGLCLVTGEDVVGGDSTTARYIGIKIEPKDVNLEILSKHQANPRVFSTCIAYFLEWISQNWDSVRRQITNEYWQIRDQNINAFRHGRLAEAYAALVIATKIFLRYGVQSGLITGLGESVYIQRFQQYLFKAIYEHSKSTLIENPAYMYLRAVQDLLNSGKLRLKRLDQESNVSDEFGFIDDEYLYLESRSVYALILNYWKQQSVHFPLEYMKTLEALERVKAIRVTSESGKKRRVLKKTKTKTSRRFLHLKIDVMNDILTDLVE